MTREGRAATEVALMRVGWILLITCWGAWCGVCSEPRAGSACIEAAVAEVSQARITEHATFLSFERSDTSSQDAAADYIATQFEAYGYAVVLDPVATSANVLARRVGIEQPEARIVVSAHFDSRAGSPGADDNASGVAVMLEMARITSTLEPAASIEFVAFALEEDGLIGSQHYADQAADAGETLLGVLNFDMVGYTCSAPGCQAPLATQAPCLEVSPSGVDSGDFFAAGANTSSTPLLADFAAAAATYRPGLQLVENVIADACTGIALWRRADHASFWDRGYPALTISDSGELRNPNYHTSGDTFATLDLGFATEVARATLAAALELAGSPAENTDVDADGFPDCIDNCPVHANPTQADGDEDGVGDRCDGEGGFGRSRPERPRLRRHREAR